jgi:hypothetical protein
MHILSYQPRCLQTLERMHALEKCMMNVIIINSPFFDLQQQFNIH